MVAREHPTGALCCTLGDCLILVPSATNGVMSVACYLLCPVSVLMAMSMRRADDPKKLLSVAQGCPHGEYINISQSA